jgi:hypothetical protein
MDGLMIERQPLVKRLWRAEHVFGDKEVLLQRHFPSGPA